MCTKEFQGFQDLGVTHNDSRLKTCSLQLT
jgi:hypothetical protein